MFLNLFGAAKVEWGCAAASTQPLGGPSLISHERKEQARNDGDVGYSHRATADWPLLPVGGPESAPRFGTHIDFGRWRPKFGVGWVHIVCGNLSRTAVAKRTTKDSAGCSNLHGRSRALVVRNRDRRVRGGETYGWRRLQFLSGPCSTLDRWAVSSSIFLDRRGPKVVSKTTLVRRER